MYRLVIALLFCFSSSYGQVGFMGCPARGDNKRDEVQAADYLKNRDEIPAAYDSVGFDDLVRMKVTDTMSEARAVWVDGYIMDIRDGGVESCNCHSKTNRDTHIYLARDKTDMTAANAVIVEVTPRMRQAMGDTRTLKTNYLFMRVRVYGYLFRDEEHKMNSTADEGKSLLWRGTVWEVHPVTKIKVL